MIELKNGSKLILELPQSEGLVVVLAMTDNGFVTWLKDDLGDCYLGHYHLRTIAGLKEAILDFCARAGV